MYATIKNVLFPEVFSKLFQKEKMRLSQRQKTLIMDTLLRRFGIGTKVYLFGSMLDDSRTGGDIDLYVEPSRIEGSFLIEERRVRRELEALLFRPVDLVLKKRRSTLFEERVREEGRLL